jgi:predicted permease
MAGPDDARRREIDEEIDAHLSARVDHLVARGLTPHEARAEALRRFGNLETARAALHAQASADRRRRGLRDRVDAVAQDVRYVVRSLARQPAFTAGVVLTLALGLGINSAVFRIADRVLFRPPGGVVSPHDVRRLEAATTANGETSRFATFSYIEARTAADAGVFDATAFHTSPRMLAAPSGRSAAVAYVDHAYLPLLGVVPAAGRFFDAREGEPGAGLAVAVVSFAFWRRELAGAPIGDLSLTLGDRTYAVVGVTPERFTGIDLDPTDVWLPLGVAELGRGVVNGVVIPWYRTEMLRSLRVIGRRAPGADDAVAAARLEAALAGENPRGFGARRILVLPIVPAGGADVSEAARRLLGRLSGVAAIVLLLACANAMHLMLARGIRRQREIATRLALGASRARVWRLLMIESVVLALAGGAAALAAGGWTGAALQGLIFPDSRWTSAWFDVRTLAFTAVAAIAAGLLAGLAPARQAAAPDLVSAIKTGRAGVTRGARATRAALLVAQPALSILMLVASGLLVLSLVRLNAVDLGFDPEGLVTVSLPSRVFTGDDGDSAALASSLAGRLRAGGAEVALVSIAPFGAVRRSSFTVPGSSFTTAPQDEPSVMDVGPSFFAVMRTRFTWGRDFSAGDVSGEPVAIVNASMARSYWGETLPPGACVLQFGSPCARVVGIVDDMREAPGAAAPMRYFLLLDERRDAPSAMVVRAAGGRAPEVVSRIRAMLPPGQRAQIEITADRVGRATRPWRTATALFTALGVVALALACIGIYSIMSFAASERVHELGVRVALGATAGDVIRLVVVGGLRFALVGGAIGLAGAAAGGRLIASLLFDVSPFEPGIYAAAFCAMTIAGLAAMLPPALRASRVSAVVALRQE